VGCLAAPPPGGPGADPTPIPDTDPVAGHDVTLSPDGAAVLAGQDVRITASVTPAFEGDLVWSSDGGLLLADGLGATFRAPGEAGPYRIAAAVPGDAASEASVDVVVTGGLAEPFTLVMIPDTQNMVRTSARASMVIDMFRWIVGQRDARNIAFVTHVGDVVAYPDRETEWVRARAGLDLRDGVVPYSVAIGDHEYLPEEDKAGSVDRYLHHFGPQRYADYDWYRGSHAAGLSHVQVFTAGGRSFLHLAVEWEPTGTADDPATPLGWARAVLEANPTLPTIITTHAYLWDMPGAEGRFPHTAREGFVLVDGRKTFVGASGETLFATLVEPFPQVFMVLDGYHHKAEIPAKGKFHQVSVNRAGSEVYEMLANFQTWPNGGDGWLRVIEFVPGGGAAGLDRIEVSTYSPVRDARGDDPFQDDERGRFGFDLDFGRRFVGF